MKTNCEFMGKIKNVAPLYTQALNGLRVKKHEVTYIFDEVGCGKTVSAIIAIASIIEEKEGQYKILVLTPKSVCVQFTDEIRDKLNVESLNIMNIAFFDNNKLAKEIKIIKKSEKIIVVSNPNKAEKLINAINQKWDLIIIDEAHDIICNSQAQTANFYDYEKYNRSTKKYTLCNRIDEEYNKFLEEYENKLVNKKELKDFFAKRKDLIESYKKENESIAQFAKSIVVEEYNRYIGHGVIKIVEERRDNKNALFSAICKLKTEKVMFLTATPYKYDKDFDFINYALAGTKMTTENGILYLEKLPNLEWVSDVYTLNSNNEGKQKMEASNTSLMFKEIAQAIPLSGCSSLVKGKERKVEVWDEKQDNNVLREKLFGEKGIFSRTDEQNQDRNPNRVIFFVSNSNEGKILFNKIFPQVQHDIASGKHIYTCKDRNVTCEFIMNKFGNASNLKKYSKESEENNIKIPDILIVTWQVAQVGVNLPTYNYVINYHIPPVPGYLEQRYGRIDRLNSEKNPLHNIYYLDNNPSTQVYRANLIKALWNYKKEIMDVPHNLPVKNLLICKELQVEKIDCKKLYESLAYYIFSYIELNKSNEDVDVKGVLESLSENGFCIEYDNKKVQIKVNNCLEQQYYTYTGDFQHDDETNQNVIENKETEELKKDNVGKQVKALCDYIKNIEKINKMAEELNKGSLGDAGSIIFLDESNSKAVVECNEIVKHISEMKNEDLQ